MRRQLCEPNYTRNCREVGRIGPHILHVLHFEHLGSFEKNLLGCPAIDLSELKQGRR